MRISVILPTYNEQENITPLVETILSFQLPEIEEIIIVDDDSPDKTWLVIKNWIKKNPSQPVRLIRRKHDRGLLKSIQEGVDSARGSYVLWMDADFSEPPELIHQLIAEIRAGNHIACGTRFRKGGGMHTDLSRKLFSRALNFVASLLLTKTITDFTTGYVLADKKLFRYIRPRGNYGEYCIDFLYRAYRRGVSISEVPYIYLLRKKGISKTSPAFSSYLRHGLVYFWTIIRLRKNNGH